MSVESLCNMTATIYRRSRVHDGFGGVTVSSDVVFSAVPCRIQPVSGTERAVYRREAVEVSTKMFVPSGYEAITEDDLVLDSGGRWYDITFVNDVDRMGHHLEVGMVEMRSDF